MITGTITYCAMWWLERVLVLLGLPQDDYHFGIKGTAMCDEYSPECGKTCPFYCHIDFNKKRNNYP